MSCLARDVELWLFCCHYDNQDTKIQSCLKGENTIEIYIKCLIYYNCVQNPLLLALDETTIHSSIYEPNVYFETESCCQQIFHF